MKKTFTGIIVGVFANEICEKKATLNDILYPWPGT